VALVAVAVLVVQAVIPALAGVAAAVANCNLHPKFAFRGGSNSTDEFDPPYFYRWAMTSRMPVGRILCSGRHNMHVRYLLLLTICLSGISLAQASAATAADNPLKWREDYKTAYRQAEKNERLLLIYFYRQQPTSAQQEFENITLHEPRIVERLARYELLKLPADKPVELDGEQINLLQHAAFAHMNGREGLAILDLQHKGQSYYARPVSCLPFETTVYYASSYAGPQSIGVLLDLPPGTLTQRTMVYAVRMHPERPASTGGAIHPVLLDECRQHSSHQARIRRQGHHHWERRFHRIWGQLGGQHPVEVCAESWPGKGLLAACIDCVHSWRQSSGHWNAVRSGHPAYGYDIRMGSNGIWYATGIFGG
jgi:hypothetical protein